VIKFVDVKKFFVFTLLLEPIIILVYLPYYLLVIKYSSWQMIRWIMTTIPFTLAVGIFLNPFEIFLVRWIDRRVK